MQAQLKIDTRPRTFIPKSQNGTEGMERKIGEAIKCSYK